jgi:hypothetical protein
MLAKREQRGYWKSGAARRSTMPQVAEVPEQLRVALEPYRNLFGAPAFRHLQTYVGGLILSNNCTVEGINRIFIQRKHPSSLNRFVTAGIWDAERVNRARLDDLKASGALLGKGWLVLDDTLTHKTGKCIEAAGIFKDHCNGQYVLGHTIVTAVFVKQDGTCYPLDFRVYLKEDYCQTKNIPFKTKYEFAKELVELAVSLGLEIEAVLFDNWYASKEFINFLQEKPLSWVTRLKSDRNVKIAGRYMAIREFAATLPKEAFKRVMVGETAYWVFSKAVDLKGVGQVRIVISYDNQELEGEPAYFATDRIQWESKRILTTYSRRGKTEGFYRDTKQNLGLEAYQLRDLWAIKRHWCLVILAYSLLVKDLWGITVKLEDKSFPTLGERIGAITKTVFAGLVRWIVTMANHGESDERIVQLAFG